MRQNSITQQILAQYLQKRLNRAGGSVQVGGRQPAQLLSPAGNDLLAGGNGVQKNDAAESLYTKEDDNDDIIGDAQFYQGQIQRISGVAYVGFENNYHYIQRQIII